MNDVLLGVYPRDSFCALATIRGFQKGTRRNVSSSTFECNIVDGEALGPRRCAPRPQCEKVNVRSHIQVVLFVQTFVG